MKRLFMSTVLLHVLAWSMGISEVQGQAAPKLVGALDSCMHTAGGTYFGCMLALDDSGRWFVHSWDANAPLEMRTGWLPYGQLPPGTPSSLSAGGVSAWETNRIYVTMENCDLYAAPGGGCFLFGSPLPFQYLGNVLSGAPVNVEGKTWGNLKGNFR